MKDSESKFSSLVGYFAINGGSDSSSSSSCTPADLFGPIATFSADVTALYRREVQRRRRLAAAAERRSNTMGNFNSPQPSNHSHPLFLQQHANSAPQQNERRSSTSVKDRLLRQGRLA